MGCSEELLKYIKKENLILIPSNRTGINLNDPIKILPYKVTQPKNIFYIDGSWSLKKGGIEYKGATNCYQVYKYLKETNNQFKKYFIFRNDMNINITEHLIRNIASKCNNGKIILPSLNYFRSIYQENKLNACMDSKRNFTLVHWDTRCGPNNTKISHINDINIKKLEKTIFYLSGHWMVGEREKLLELFNITCNHNKKLNDFKNFWDNGENWFFGLYILVKEGLNESLDKNKNEQLVYKYFDFIKNICCYFNRGLVEKKSSFSKEATYPCVYCKMNNVLDDSNFDKCKSNNLVPY
jgi:hypothetical protein